MKRLLFIALIAIGHFCYAQDYAPVYTNQQIHFFEDTSTTYSSSFGPFQLDIIGLNTDSFQIVANDTVIFGYDEVPIITMMYSCDTAEYARQGDQIIKSLDQTIFFNKGGDSIFFKHNVSVNSRWKIMDLQNKEDLVCNVFAKGTAFVNNTTDSIAFLELFQADSAGSRLTNGFADTLRLSKSNGLLDFKIWRDFPNANQNLNLFRVDIEIPTIGEIYDYEIGDEFHYQESYGSAAPPSYSNVIILDKWHSNANDTVFYERHVLGETSTVDYSTNPPSLNYNRTQNFDTIYYTNLDEKVIDAVVGELHNNPGFSLNRYMNGHMYHLYPKSYVSDRRMLTAHYYLYYDQANDCYQINTSEEFYTVGEGLGITWNYFDYAGSAAAANNQMIYYSKGNETYGTPYNIVIGLDENSTEVDQFILYPNPANDQFQIKGITQNSRIWIYDLSGKLKMNLNVNPNSSVDISRLESGMYLIQIESDGAVVRKKLLVK